MLCLQIVTRHVKDRNASRPHSCHRPSSLWNFIGSNLFKDTIKATKKKTFGELILFTRMTNVIAFELDKTLYHWKINVDAIFILFILKFNTNPGTHNSVNNHIYTILLILFIVKAKRAITISYFWTKFIFLFILLRCSSLGDLL